jgi:pimeloyl-ACP methyl ester carboxylesterase
VLLHGFPASSHQYRNLVPALADRFHVIAPDYPGFGLSDRPDPDTWAYTFDHLSEVIERSSTQGFSRYGSSYRTTAARSASASSPEIRTRWSGW